jgi:hypothetical protein
LKAVAKDGPSSGAGAQPNNEEVRTSVKASDADVGSSKAAGDAATKPSGSRGAFGAISQEATARWRNMSQEKKEPFKRMAAADKARYNVELKLFWKNERGFAFNFKQ